VLASGKYQLQIEFRFKRDLWKKYLIADIIGMQKKRSPDAARDITEEREMQERLYLTDRLASVGQMAACVAHGIEQPLNRCCRLSQLLLETGAPSEMKEGPGKLSEQEGQRAASIVKNLLSFARSHTTSIQSVDINAVICRSAEFTRLRRQANNIEITTHLAPEPARIMSDRFQMQQVFPEYCFKRRTGD